MRAKVTLAGVTPGAGFRRPRPYAVAVVAAASLPSALVLVRPLAPEAPPAEGEAPTTPASPLEVSVDLFAGDAGAWLAVEGFVLESDGGAVPAGARLDESRHVLGLGSLGAEGLPAPAAGRAVLAAARAAVELLERRGDGVLGSFSVRVPSAAARPGTLAFGGDRAEVRVALELPDAPAQTDPKAVEAPAPARLRPAPAGSGAARPSGEPVPATGAVAPRQLADGEVLAAAQPGGPAREAGAVDPGKS